MLFEHQSAYTTIVRSVRFCVLVGIVCAQVASAFSVGGVWAPKANDLHPHVSRLGGLSRGLRGPVRRSRCRSGTWFATSNLEVGSGSDAKPQDVEFREGSFVVDGFRCYYCVATPPEGSVDAAMDPVVFVHGSGSSSAHFNKNLEPLAAELRCPIFSLDLLGYGKSAKPIGVLYGHELWGWQVETFLDDVVKAEPVFLVGHGVGGYTCMTVAASEPKRVAGLALMSPGGRYGVINPSGLDAPWYRWSFVAEELGARQFRKFADTEAARDTLRGLYANPSKSSVVSAEDRSTCPAPLQYCGCLLLRGSM